MGNKFWRAKNSQSMKRSLKQLTSSEANISKARVDPTQSKTPVLITCDFVNHKNLEYFSDSKRSQQRKLDPFEQALLISAKKSGNSRIVQQDENVAEVDQCFFALIRLIRVHPARYLLLFCRRWAMSLHQKLENST